MKINDFSIILSGNRGSIGYLIRTTIFMPLSNSESYAGLWDAVKTLGREICAQVEDLVNALEPFSDHKPPKRSVEIQNIGLTISATRLIHLQYLDELLAYGNDVGLCAFAERSYPEHRVDRGGQRGIWQPKESI